MNIPGNIGTTLINNGVLNGGQFLSSGNDYYAVMQDNGSFAVFRGTKGNPEDILWNTPTVGKGTYPWRLVLQGDGNLVIYDAKNTATWNSQTNGKGVAPFRLIMQQDANLVLYDKNNSATWASNTCKK